MPRLLVSWPSEQWESGVAGGGSGWSHRRRLRHACTVRTCARRRKAGERPSGSGVGDGRCLADPKLEPFGAAILGMTAESIPTSEAVTAQVAFVVASFEMDLVVMLVGAPLQTRLGSTYRIKMSIEVGLALEFLGAGIVTHHRGTRVRILALGIVRLEVRFPVVTTLEELAANPTFMGGLFWSRPLPFLLDARYTWKDGLHIKSRKSAVCRGMKFGDVTSRVVLGPLCRLCSIQVLGLRGESVLASGVGERPLRG